MHVHTYEATKEDKENVTAGMEKEKTDGCIAAKDGKKGANRPKQLSQNLYEILILNGPLRRNDDAVRNHHHDRVRIALG